MKLQLASNSSLAIELEFTVTKSFNKIKLFAGRLGHFDKIGVCLSGGLDSAALLCLILTELKNTNMLELIPVTCFTVIKNDGATFYADRLVRKVREKFGCQIEHVTNIGNPHVNKFPSLVDAGVMRHLTHLKKNMIYYVGMNLPPLGLTEFNNSSLALHSQIFAMNNHLVAPFLNMHKPQLIDILYKLNCDDLIQYTHSCVMQPVGHCDNCFSCEERAWGFDQLGLIDPGTIPPEIDVSYSGTWRV